MLALFRSFVRRLRPDGVRALKDRIEEQDLQLAGCLMAAEGEWAWSPALQATVDLRLAYDLLRRANAENPQAETDRPEERQNQNG